MTLEASHPSTQDRFALSATDGVELACYCWRSGRAPKGIVQISHSMGEHARRYEEFAARLTAAGYAVYANDHRGHGETMTAAPGHLGEDGWNRAIDDLALVADHATQEHPATPLIYFGHSMGALLGQQFLYRHGDKLSAAVLSGSPGQNRNSTAQIARFIARVQRRRHGAGRHSNLLQSMIFEGSNKAFGASGFEWLTRDQAQVARYLDDPKCGFVLTAGSMLDMFSGAIESSKSKNIRRIPKNLPIYVFSGSADPVHQNLATLNRLLDAYHDAELNVTFKLYPGGRHEMLNEINRDQVIANTIDWLDAQIDHCGADPS